MTMIRLKFSPQILLFLTVKWMMYVNLATWEQTLVVLAD